MGVLKVKQTDGTWRDVGCAPGGAVFSDDFNRANSTTTLGSDWTTGSVNNAGPSTWGVSGTKAYVVSSYYNGVSFFASTAYRDAGTADVDQYVTFSTSNLSPDFNSSAVGLLIRATSAMTNFLVATPNRLVSVTPGAPFVNVGSYAGGAASSPVTIRAVTTGSTVQVYRNGTLVLTYTTSMSGTLHGLVGDGAGTISFRYDDYSITTGSPSSPGRLKIWTGSGWVVEKCGGDATVGRPLKALIGGVWTEVACMVPV